jgi:hypothetical protein
MMRNDEITAVLRRIAVSETDENARGDSAADRASCDVVYVLFLEPRENGEPVSTSIFERLTDAAIKRFSPTPTISHCEIALPPIPDSASGHVNFATYVGHHAGWQNVQSKAEGVDFYLINNGSRWRALPVFGRDITNAVRSACEANVGAPYSLAQYPTSTWLGRGLAWLWDDRPRHGGHCATITARVLKAAGVSTAALEHPSAWYSPGSLYHALHATVGGPLEASEHGGLRTVDPQTCAEAIETLLLKPLSYAAVRALGDAACIDAVRTLTAQVCAASERCDPAEGRRAQKRLGTALLRWMLLREDGLAPSREIFT